MADILDPETAPAYSVKEARGWRAVFNYTAPRQMDVQLHKVFVHDAYVKLVPSGLLVDDLLLPGLFVHSSSPQTAHSSPSEQTMRSSCMIYLGTRK